MKKIRKIKKIKRITEVNRPVIKSKAVVEDSATGAYIQKAKLQKLIETVEYGVPVPIAAAALKIPIEKWLTKESVVDALSQAEAVAITNFIKNISEAAKENGSLSKEMLQILWPESFQKAPVSSRKLGE